MIASAGLRLRQWIAIHRAGAPGAVVDFTVAHLPQPVQSCMPGSTAAGCQAWPSADSRCRH